LRGVWLAVAVADDCNAVIEVVHAVATRVVLVPASNLNRKVYRLGKGGLWRGGEHAHAAAVQLEII
jgi:hypothetical protein